ncbi:hypothetical protein WR25_20674 [Diploscapter pachys]|uniref:Uncharacterized protein n=1 Tax=Diploscapter pachys TaxID=2018661 RepID=A0A2A2J506_9BILA|nr:hypothetical protein WR25_20674 [Diploscapter pachys]
MQFNFECCGVSINDKMDANSTINETSPWNSWFRYQILGANYPYVMRWYYGLPHSCCKKLTTTDCEHIGMSRYLQRDRKQDVFFAEEDKAIQIDWNVVTYDKTKERDSKAKNSIYPGDCKDIVVKNVAAKIRLIAYIIFAVCAFLLIFNVLMSACVFFRRRSLSKNKKKMTPSKGKARKIPKFQ